jgi:hypothetical protein
MAKSTALRPPRYKFEYAAKFICTSSVPGTSQNSGSFVPGNYQTVVNIHNPGNTVVKFRMKITSGQGVSQFLDRDLGPDKVWTVSCANIRDFNPPLIHGFEGFLVIQSAASFDVVAVYSAAPTGGQVSSIDVEYVKERVMK